MRYRVSTLEKKSVTEVQRWTKGDEEIIYRIGWRWGAVIMDEKPDLSSYNQDTDQIDVYNDWSCELDSCDDGCWDEWEYPESWSEEEIEAFQEAWEEDYHDAPLAMGFDEGDSELWFSGPLEITEIE